MSPSPPPSPSPPSTPEPVAIDLSGFEFGVTIHLGMDWDRLRLPEKYTSVVDGQESHELIMPVQGGSIG
jgi:hypothetical protein